MKLAKLMMLAGILGLAACAPSSDLVTSDTEDDAVYGRGS